jgi:murein DD-endopeptidase MepM/ murein hydrolase activator NlpD
VSRASSRRHRIARAAKPLGLGLAAFALALTMAFTMAPQSAEATSSTGLSEQLKDLRANLKEVRANLKKAEAARKAALNDLAALDESLDYAQKAYDAAHSAYGVAAARLAELEAQLDKLMTQLESNQQQLTKTENELAGQQEALCSRMVNLYKSGGTMGYLSALVGDRTDSLVEVVERFQLLSTVAEEDARLLAKIGDLKDQIVEQRLALQEERARVSSLEEDQAAITGELQAADQECKVALSEIEAARAAKKAVLTTIEKNQALWAQQEDQLQADSGRITALLNKTKAVTPTKAGKGVLSWPVVAPVTSGFGYRIHPIFRVRSLHTGIDLDAAMGESIKAAAAGTVIFAGWRGGYGKCIIIDHGGGIATLYAHQSTILASAGQVVKRGAVIGKVGSTGYSTGPHLHFEVRVNGSPVDPMGYL